MSGANLTGVNFTGAATSWSISGTISPSAAGSGATVTLSRKQANATTTANASRKLHLHRLANGNYTVTPSISGYAFTPPNQAVTMSGANLTRSSISQARRPLEHLGDDQPVGGWQRGNGDVERSSQRHYHSQRFWKLHLHRASQR